MRCHELQLGRRELRLIRGDAFASCTSTGPVHIQLPHPKDLSRQPAKAVQTELLLFLGGSRLLPQARSTNERVLPSIRTDSGMSFWGETKQQRSKGSSQGQDRRGPSFILELSQISRLPFIPSQEQSLMQWVLLASPQPSMRHTGHIFHYGK